MITTVQPRVSRVTLTEAYEDQTPLLRRIANRFARRFAKDPDETFAEASLVFLSAYHSFDPARGTCIEQRLQSVVWAKLLDGVRKDARRHSLLARTEVEDFDALGVEQPEPFDRDDLESTLTTDARTVVALLFDTPGELLTLIRGDASPGPNAVKRSLCRYLRRGLSWSAARVRDAFTEIGEAISE